MATRPLVIAFDVNETLVALDPVRNRLVQAGLPENALRLFFAQMLRDAFALEVAGTYQPFMAVARASLEVTLANLGHPGDKKRVDEILAGFAELPAHADVRPAFERARQAGMRLITLTNGSAQNTERLLAKAGLSDLVERTLSIDEVQHWKPHPVVYRHAAQVMNIVPAQMALVAAHAWDTHGAKQAGLVTGWVRRQDKSYSAAMFAPDVRGDTLVDVINQLASFPMEP